VIASLRDGAAAAGTDLEAALDRAAVLFHGTTLSTNAVIEGTGATVGLVTTAGHGDALAIGRTTTRTEGLTRRQRQHYAAQEKPDPLVPKRLIREVDERTDYEGAAVVGLDEDAAREAVADLAGEVDDYRNLRVRGV